MATHELKTHPAPFQAIMEGAKTFELRVDDRDPPFAVGDRLHLREWDPATGEYTGYAVGADVSYLLRGPAFGLPGGYVIMSLEERTFYPRGQEPNP
jgi:ParB family transcriptional regulator, chromosome partitioning protein